ncbi:MAG: elongation factor G [Phycisphaeraceae bacterium]|nr:elongation factor G [Phycisphaeraceae bacterium]
MAYSTNDIRNIALAGHAWAGKTTLVERLLHHKGLTGRMGMVEEGNTVCDFEDEEKHHKHTLSPAVVHLEHEGRQINLIDTPGYPDLAGVAMSCFPAVETVAIVIDASVGIQMNTRRMMRFAKERRLPTMLIINKIDHEGVNLIELRDHIADVFGPECVPVNKPCKKGTDVVDLLETKTGETDLGTVAESRTKLLDQIAEVDDTLAEKYLEDPDSITPEEWHDALIKALRESHLIPVVYCSAKTGVGVDDLLHIFANVCPSPLEGNPRPFLKTEDDGEETPFRATQNPEDHVLAHVFRIATDPFVGKVAYFRVHQGVIKHGDQLLVDRSTKKVRLAHIHRPMGKDLKEIDRAIPGDIACVTKIDEIHYGSVLHDHPEEAGVHLKPLDLPRPMQGLALVAKSRSDETKIGGALQKLVESDPSFVVERVEATGETVARGMGELHLRIMLEKLKNRFGVEVDTHTPKVAYKETILAKAEGHHRHKKQTGGAGQFGEVFLRVEPIQGGEQEFEFVDDTFGGSVPRQFLPAIEKGVRMVLNTGAFAGYPLTRVRVSVYDGKHHPVDSKEVAFVTAGKRAFIDAVAKAKPALLEPFVDMEVVAPAERMGDITSDLIGKRGRVMSTDMGQGGMCIIKATAPLSELDNYAGRLKSMTGGVGSFVMEYSHDEVAPPNVQAHVVAQFKGHGEED